MLANTMRFNSRQCLVIVTTCSALIFIKYLRHRTKDNYEYDKSLIHHHHTHNFSEIYEKWKSQPVKCPLAYVNPNDPVVGL